MKPRAKPITILPGEPLRPNHLLILFGWEAGEISTEQATSHLGMGKDIVGARELREWAVANVRHVLAGGLPNIRREGHSCGHPGHND